MQAPLQRTLKNFLNAAACTVILLTCTLNAQAQSANEMQTSIYEVYQTHKNAVVQVFGEAPAAEAAAANQTTTQAPPTPNRLFVGTGFFISQEGLVVTSASVAGPAQRLWVEHGGARYPATKLGVDSLTNLAFIRIEKTDLQKNNAARATFPHIALPTQHTLPQIGTFLVSLSRPVGLPASPRFGLLTGHNITYGTRALPTLYLRTDIPSQGGETGSPVFNLNGELVGVRIAALQELSSSFILPTEAVLRVRDAVVFSGQVRYAWFGLRSKEVYAPAPLSENAEPQKAKLNIVIEAIDPLGPAAKSELKPGDIIQRIGTRTISSTEDLRRATFFTQANSKVHLTVLRSGQPVNVTLEVGELPLK